MTWTDVFGAPAGGREGTRSSPAVPAGAPAPTQNGLELAHLLTRLFMFTELVFWQEW